MNPVRRKRILLATECFPPHPAGSARTVLGFAVDLARDHQVTVLTPQYDEKLPLREEVQGVRVLRVPVSFRESSSPLTPLTLLRFLTLLPKHDHVIIDSPHSHVLFIAFFAKLFLRRVTIYHQGDLILPRGDGHRVERYLLEKFCDWLTIPAMMLADRIGTYTRDYCEQSRVLRRFPRKWFTAIPRVEAPKKLTRGPTAIAMKQLADKHTLIGFVGRFSEEKGFDLLVRALPLVAAKVKDVCFVFAGDRRTLDPALRDQVNEILERYGKHFVFMGYLEQTCLWEFYRKLDVFVVPSRTECFPLAQVEAAVAGIPIVATNVPGVRVLVRETKIGELVAPESPEAIAEGILKVLEHRKKYRAHRENVGAFLMAHEHIEAA